MQRRMIAALMCALVVLALVGAVAWLTDRPAPPDPTPGPVSTVATRPVAETDPDRAGTADRVPTGTPSPQQARQQLAALTRAAADSTIPYRRSEFGPAWSDVDHNSCDTRSDVLADWLTGVATDGGCRVVAGVLYDLYTARTVDSPRALDIDHVVSLGNAWRSGAARWGKPERLAFANDRRHLLPVAASANRAKGDRAPDEWMPPNTEYHCEYARIVVGTKAHWRLAITPREADALGAALATC